MAQLSGSYHFNIIRIYLYQDPQNYDGGCGESVGRDPCDLPDVNANINYINSLLAMEGAGSFYWVIDYHPVGGYIYDDLYNWWSVVAPLYKDNANVIYELSNEPVAWNPSNYTATDVNNFESVYTLMRSEAPNTMIWIWDFANSNEDMVTLIDSGSDISYSNAAVGFHAYSYDDTHISNLYSNYPVIETEIGGYSAAQYTDTVAYIESKGFSWIGLDMVDHIDVGDVEVTWNQDPLATG